MPYFNVNKNPHPDSGDHEVHEKDADCGHEPDAANRKDLGWHSDCHDAVEKAKETYSQSNGCYYCCNECHTT